MTTRLRLHLSVAATLLLLLLTLVAGPAHADSQYEVSLCGYGAPDTLATTFANLDAPPEAQSPCYVVDPGSGEQPGGAYLGSVWTAPAGEAITGVITAYDNIYANTGGGEDGWVSGIAVNISGSYGQYLGGGVPNCVTGGVCENYLNGGVEVTGLDASNLGILLVCELGGCIDAGGTSVYADGLVAIVDDPHNNPAITGSGSLADAATGDWINGATAGASLSLNYSASDPSSVCTMTAALTDSSGNIVASASPSLTDPYIVGYPWFSGQPCSIGPSGSFAPNLSDLATGTYHLNVNAQSAQNQEAQTAGGWLTGSSWSQGLVLRVDNTPPTGTLSASSSVWSSTPERVTVAASDVGSGVQSVSCTGPGAPSSAIPASQLPYTITVSQDGTDTIRCTATDNVGNTASIGSTTVKIDDQQAPVSFSGPSQSTWYSSAQTLHITAAETNSLSGVQGISCAVNGATATTYTAASADIPVSGNGANQISCSSVTNAGVTSDTANYTVRIDTNTPTVAFGTTASSGLWYTNANLPEIDVNGATAGDSGIDHVTCNGDGLPSDYTIPAASGTIRASDLNQRAGQISCTSTSAAGITSSAATLTVQIDDTVPTATITSNVDSGTWYSSASAIPTVSVSSTAGPSGIASITCQAPGAFDTITTTSGTLDLSTLRDGADTITCTPLTPAGVDGTPATLAVQLDSQTPTLSFAGHASQSTWYPSVASIPGLDTNATTGPSGLASIDCSGDGTANQSSAISGSALTLTGLQQGTGAVTCTASSVAGLTSRAQAFTLSLDSAAPTAAWQTSQSQTTWYPSTASVPALALNAAANGASGVDHITCSGDGLGSTVTITGASGTVHPTGFADGVNTISCVPDSGAGVRGAVITRTILVDDTAPAIALSGTDSSTWYPAAQTVNADASADTNPSGVQSVSCSLDGGTATVTDADHASQPVSGDGVHTASCHALSGAGVAGPAASTSVKIDTQTPTVTQTVIPAAPSDPAGTVEVLVTAAEANPLSGIASTSCSLDHQAATVVQGGKQTVAVSSAGTHTLVCSATTRAGVTSADSTQSYTVASDPGQFSLQYGTVPTAWQSGPVTVPVQLTGATAANYSSLTCTVGGASQTTINGTSGSVAVTDSGSQQVACYATANNGADTAALTQMVKIDQQTPTASWSDSSTPPGEQVTVIGSEQTPLSGIASESCSVDGGTPQTTDTPQLTITVNGNGAHQIACAITSGAGVTAHVSHTANVSVPVPAPLAISAPDPGRWYHAPQSIVLGIPGGGPTITAALCTLSGVSTNYPVTGSTVTVNVAAPGGDVRCLDVDNDGQQSATVDFPVHIDTGAPSGYFIQTGPATAVASISNQGSSGLQSVTIQYQIGSGPWVTIPGTFDASSSEISVSLPAALRRPGVRYALQAIAVNNAGGRTIIATMKDGSPAAGTAPATSGAEAAVNGGLYVGTVPPGGNAAASASSMTVKYGQKVSLAGTLSLASGQASGQTVSIIEHTAGASRQLTATTLAGGRFVIKLGAGPSRAVTYTLDGVSHTVAIRVRGQVAVAVHGAAPQRTLTVAAAGATGRVAYRLQQDRGGHWLTLGGTHHTKRRGHTSIQLPATLATTPPRRLRVLITPQHTWHYLKVRQTA